jgi:hypothetical protein
MTARRHVLTKFLKRMISELVIRMKLGAKKEISVIGVTGPCCKDECTGKRLGDRDIGRAWCVASATTQGCGSLVE